MIASILHIPGPATKVGEDQFARFMKETKGVVHTYRLEGDDGVSVVTIWDNETSRAAYMGSALKQEVDKTSKGQQRKVYKVLAGK